MKSNATTVEQYLSELPAERREALQQVRTVIRQNADPLIEEGILYGMIGYYIPHRVYPPGYHCDPKLPLGFVCLGSQKNYMSVYLGCVYGHPGRSKWFREAWAHTGKKLDMGKSCVRFRSVEDLALDVVGEAVRKVSVHEFLREYEMVLKGMRRRGGTDTPARPRKAKAKPAKAKGKKAKTKVKAKGKAAARSRKKK